MKKLTLIALLIITLTSCGDGFDTNSCYKEVEKEYPHAKNIFQKGFRFVVVDSSNNVWYVESMSLSSASITMQRKVNR